MQEELTGIGGNVNDQTLDIIEARVGKPRTLVRRGLTVGFVLFLALLIASCSSSEATSTPLPAPTDTAVHAEADEDGHSEDEEEHEDSAESGEHGHDEESEEHGDSGSAAHMVPDNAAAVPNPVAATDDSIDSGSALFATSCAVCHGETGVGDGPTAEGLDPKPANLQEDHVQDLSDGGLFYIISNGVEGTAMVAWNEVFSDEEMWHLVNFLRTLHHE